MGQVVERGHDVPAVHLALVDLLRAMIQARRIAQAHRVGRGEQAEEGVRADHTVLVEQRQVAFHLKHALDHEHHVRPAGIIFIKHQSAGVLQAPWQQAFAGIP